MKTPVSDKWPNGWRKSIGPNGDVRPLNRKRSLENRISTRSPALPRDTYTVIDGETDASGIFPIVTEELASSNPRNVASFVRAT